MNKKEAIQLLNQEGWTEADAKRALSKIDFKITRQVDELTVRRLASQFAGNALIQRQRAQGAQKALVTKEQKKLAKSLAEIERLKLQAQNIITSPNSQSNSELDIEVKKLIEQKNKLSKDNQELKKANKSLMQDNKDLKNVVDAIKLGLTKDVKDIMQDNDLNKVRQRLFRILKSTLG